MSENNVIMSPFVFKDLAAVCEVGALSALAQVQWFEYLVHLVLIVLGIALGYYMRGSKK